MPAFEKLLDNALGLLSEEGEKDFDALKVTLLPLQHGWTEAEVIEAMMPDIMKYANYYGKITPGVDVDDLIQQGAIGVLKAMETDKGIANFASHAKNYLRSFMRPGKTGYEMTGTSTSIKDPAVSGVSIEKPIGGAEGEMTLGATLGREEPGLPSVLANKELLAKIMDAANLTPVERKIIELSYGIGGEEEEALRTAEDVEPAPRPSAKKLRGPVAQKKGKFARRTGAGGQEIRGTKEIADILGVSKQAVNAARNRALLKLIRAAHEIAPGEFEEYPGAALESISRFFRIRIIEAIVDGSINGVILE